VSCGFTELFCPRCAVVTKARLRVVPVSLDLRAKTMSRGSSPTSKVRFTRGGDAATSTMLMLSERWFTTHTSPLSRAATATGSSPTCTEPVRAIPPVPTVKISSRLSGVLTAKSRVPSGDCASGRTCPDSNSVKDGCAPATPESDPINERTSSARPCPFVTRSMASPLKDQRTQLLSRTVWLLFQNGVGRQAESEGA
jgi:hypothetical protein